MIDHSHLTKGSRWIVELAHDLPPNHYVCSIVTIPPEPGGTPLNVDALRPLPMVASATPAEVKAFRQITESWGVPGLAATKVQLALDAFLRGRFGADGLKETMLPGFCADDVVSTDKAPDASHRHYSITRDPIDRGAYGDLIARVEREVIDAAIDLDSPSDCLAQDRLVKAITVLRGVRKAIAE